MAIPFFESYSVEPAANQQNVDQVDGPVASHQSYASMHSVYESSAINQPSTQIEQEAPSSSSSVASTPTTPPSPPPPSSMPNDELAWKTLAVAMCKVLKEHYNQKAQQSNNAPITSAVVQITPNGQVTPIWK